ncbi:tripartite tricarboxylate transporter substrate binding protein [Limnohabitans sp. Rim8]|uniref:Bug family tripartite tricarboxylate transporter substrate binding protein n=1 Tax=Limnohabitans sp. Rim8 TaxID=1100718 RepID=UPI0033057BE4
MKTLKNNLIRMGVALAVMGLTAVTSTAQTYPIKALKLVVPYAAGGSTDQLARAIAEPLGRALGQPVVVENKPGGNTIIGADAVAKSTPDGYTLFMGSSASLAVNPLLYSKLPYDPSADFAGVSMLAASPLVMVVPASLPVTNVKEFVDLAKRRPDALNFASVGNGNPLHLAGELFKVATGIEMTHVPYNGSAPALTALLGNQVQVMFDVVLTSNPHIQSGKLRALALTGTERLALLPNVPTIAGSGYPGYEAGIWFAMVVPKATPAAIVARLNAEVTKILAQPDMKARFDGLALELIPGPSEEVAKYAQREQARWGRLIRDKGIRLEL